MAKVQRKAMGRGLGSILKDPKNDIQSIEDANADKVVGNIIELDVECIEINPFQPRTSFNEETLKELSGSIKELGVIQPITVRKVGFNAYQLISGERRLRASKLAGLKMIPAYVRIANDNDSLVMALVENIQRHDLDPIEIALSYQRLIDEIELTQEQMSERVGKKRSTITNYLRLLKLSPTIQTGIRDGAISMGHGKALMGLENEEEQLKVYHKIVEENLSVREAEQFVKEFQNLKNTPEKSPKKVSYTIADKKKKIISDFFGTNIDVKIGVNGKGKISIPFQSDEDLERILNLLEK